EIKPPYFGARRFVRSLEDRLGALGSRLVLLFDEAQALGDSTLEHLRLLVNDIAEGSGAIQLIFIAQPEFAVRLKRPALRALDQRVVTRVQLWELARREVREYVLFRLVSCGGAGNLFSRAALRELVREDVRVPARLILYATMP